MSRRNSSSSYLRGEATSPRRESSSPIRSVSSNDSLGPSSPRRRPSFTRSSSERSLGSTADDSLTGYVIGDATANKSLRSLRSGSDHQRSGARRPRSLSRPRTTYALRTVTNRKNHPNKKGRLSKYLSVYILLVFLYMFVSLRRLHSGDMSPSQHQRQRHFLSGPSSLSLVRMREWILSGRRQRKDLKHRLYNSLLVQFPPLYPKISRTDDVRLSHEALRMCTRTLWHTLETTTIVLPDHETFVHTGDIDDLWLRDSAAQVHPLLIPILEGGTKALIQVDDKLDRIVSGLIKRTSMYIRHDPYANAFRIDDTYVFNDEQKKLGRHDLISTWN